MYADRINRALLTLLGVALLAAGTAGILAGADVFGHHLGDRHLTDNPIARYLGDNHVWFWPFAALAGVLAALFALRWLIAVLTPRPRAGDITIDTVDGNHVVLDVGGGQYVFYAHLQKGSVTVEPGAHVTRGEVLGKLGNSGNTSGPHLHVHLMDAPSPIAAQGLPYVTRGFTLTGQIDAEAFAAAPGVEGVWLSGPQPAPVEQSERFPLNLDVVAFP